MPSELLLKQFEFSRIFGLLLVWIYQNGYTCTFGEAFRTPEQAAIYAANGSGIKNSLHTKRLAVDINLFVDGNYQGDSDAYKELGTYWESLGGCWGGRWGDGNHFSIEFNGVK